MKKVIFAIVIAGSVMLSSCGGSTTKCEVSSTDTTTVDSVVTQTVDTVKTK
jgi:outer membrane murein-binding lipoprotein Lpp